MPIRELGDWCTIDLADEEGGLRNVATAHVDPELVRLASELRERYPVDPDSPTGTPNVIRTGKSELYEEIPDEMLVEAAVDEEHLKMMREIGLGLGHGRPAGGARTGARGDHLRLLESGPTFRRGRPRAGRGPRAARGLAIDNAMLFRREHDAAVTLQRSLLPESLPELPGVESPRVTCPPRRASRSAATGTTSAVLGDGRAAMTIGDIAGRGINAAAVMGRVRAWCVRSCSTGSRRTR